MLKDSRKKCPDVKKPNVQVISLCNLCDWFLSYDQCCRFVKLLASCWGLGRMVLVLLRELGLPAKLSVLYIAEIPWQSGNPLVLRAGLASLTQTCVVFLFVEVNYCPPLEC